MSTDPGHQSLQDLHARVARLEDAEVARGLQHEYAALLDAPVPEQVAALWTEDGVLSVPSGDFVGRAALAQLRESGGERAAADGVDHRVEPLRLERP